MTEKQIYRSDAEKTITISFSASAHKIAMLLPIIEWYTTPYFERSDSHGDPNDILKKLTEILQYFWDCAGEGDFGTDYANAVLEQFGALPTIRNLSLQIFKEMRKNHG